MPITLTKHDHLIQQFIYHHVLTISHHSMPCKNKLDVLYFVVASFTWLLRAEQEPFLPTHQNHNDFSSSMCCFNLQQGPGVATLGSTKVGETVTRKPPMCKAHRENRSRVSVRVMSVRAASSNNTAEPKYDMLVSSMTCIAHNSLVFYSCI